MAYSVAEDAAVLEAAHRVLAAAKSIVSQRALRNLVVTEVRTTQPDARVSEDRLRRLLANSSKVRIELRARKGPREKILSRCPVCDARLERIKNQTLFGGEVTLTLRCPTCGYWTGKEKRVPTLYIFHYGAGPGGMARPHATS